MGKSGHFSETLRFSLERSSDRVRDPIPSDRVRDPIFKGSSFLVRTGSEIHRDPNPSDRVRDPLVRTGSVFALFSSDRVRRDGSAEIHNEENVRKFGPGPRSTTKVRTGSEIHLREVLFSSDRVRDPQFLREVLF